MRSAICLLAFVTLGCATAKPTTSDATCTPAARVVQVPGIDESSACPGLGPDVARSCGQRPRDESPSELLEFARCERESGRLVDALRDSQRALERSIQVRDPEAMKTGRALVQAILGDVPHVTFDAPLHTAVTFDERQVPSESLSKMFSVDPGLHTVVATDGTGQREQISRYCIRVGEKRTLRLSMR